MSASEKMNESVNDMGVETSRQGVGGLLMRAFFEQGIMEEKRRYLDQDPPDVGSFLIVAEPLIERVTAMAREEERFAWSMEMHRDAQIRILNELRKLGVVGDEDTLSPTLSPPLATVNGGQCSVH